MSLQEITIDTDLSADQFKSIVPMPSSRAGALSLASYLRSLAGRIRTAFVSVKVGAVQAAGSIVVSAGGSSNNQTMTICGVTFTAKTSGATGNQFNVSATAATQASNMATAINASANLAGICTASAANGTVTLTAVVPGVIGNGLVAANVDLANVVITSFSAGSDGTEYELDLE